MVGNQPTNMTRQLGELPVELYADYSEINDAYYVGITEGDSLSLVRAPGLSEALDIAEKLFWQTVSDICHEKLGK